MEPLARGDPYAIKSIGQLIDFINGGQDAERIRDQLNPLLSQNSRIAEHSGAARKVELAIKVKFTVNPNGKVDIMVDESVKATKLPRNEETVFIAENGELSAMNPNRGTMFEGADLGRRK